MLPGQGSIFFDSGMQIMRLTANHLLHWLQTHRVVIE